MKRIRLWLRGIFRPEAVERELKDELLLHLEMEIEKNFRNGMTEREARRKAMLDFGGVERFKDQTREARKTKALEDILGDLGFALRQLRKRPGFTTVVILTLGLGIGATTSIFTVVSGVLLQPLPFHEADRLVTITTYFHPESGFDFPDYGVGSPEYFDYLAETRTMESVAAVSQSSITLVAGDGDPEIVQTGDVSPSFFTVLRARPYLGRTLIEADGGAEPARVAVLSYELWQTRFGADPTIVGRSIEFGGTNPDNPNFTEIVGVMPQGFQFESPDIQLWRPLLLDPARTWRGGHWFSMLGRLAQGVTLEESETEMASMMERWAVAYPDHHVGHGLQMKPVRDYLVKDARSTLLLLLGAVGFLLLIACVNVASLLLARSEDRKRDVAVRGALGANRSRLFQQLLTESFLLASLGGLLGLFLAWVGTDAILALSAGTIPRMDEVALDGGVLAFTSAVVLLTTLVFGMVPAIQEANTDLGAVFRICSRSTTAGKGQMRLRQGLVVVETALSVLLVVGAGLMAKSFAKLVTDDPGFQKDNLLVSSLSLPSSRYGWEEAQLLFDGLADEVRAVPGVESVTLVERPPLLHDGSQNTFHIEGRDTPIPDEWCCTGGSVSVGPGFFRNMGVPLVRGRYLEADDHRLDAQPVVVVDELTARRFWPDVDPIGAQVRFLHTEGPWHEVVGVVGNVTWDAPGEFHPTFYNSRIQILSWAGGFMGRGMYFITRTAGDPRAAIGPFRALVKNQDPNLPVRYMGTMDDIMSATVARPRFILTLLGIFAGLALSLGALGIYGVISHGVAQRTGEIGVRRALGARDSEVVGMVVRQGLVLAGWGIALGLLAAVLSTRVLTSFLYEVSPLDPATYLAVGVGVVVVAVLASYVPGRRASGVDPLEALRME